MSRLGKNSCRLFEFQYHDRQGVFAVRQFGPLPDGRGTATQKSDGQCWRGDLAECSRKREAQVRLLVVSQAAIAQEQCLTNLVAVSFVIADCLVVLLDETQQTFVLRLSDLP